MTMIDMGVLTFIKYIEKYLYYKSVDLNNLLLLEKIVLNCCAKCFPVPFKFPLILIKISTELIDEV